MDYRTRIFDLHDGDEFWAATREIFLYQYHNNVLYKEFIDALKINPAEVSLSDNLPFLPVEFFRNHKILTGDRYAEKIFESSGTTGFEPAKHFVTDLSLYEDSFINAFKLFYGDPEDYLIAALLPSYTEREGSSLVYMADKLIRLSKNKSSGFFRDNIGDMLQKISRAQKKKQKILLLGVSFALLDLAEKFSPDLSGIIVMETGGMKGRRKEITRAEMHEILKNKLNIITVHSEYGMTELMSQAYSKGEGIFYCPPWMKILVRDQQDPLTIINEHGKTGGINIIDLANINSCAFIATSDLGKVYEDGGFEVLGRFDNSDIRGCNLLIE